VSDLNGSVIFAGWPASAGALSITTILCALSLMSLVVGPFAAAVALRQGLE